jgi:predicted amidohydrolase
VPSFTSSIRKQLLHHLLANRSRPEGIVRHIRTLRRHDSRLQRVSDPVPESTASPVRPSTMRVAAVQMRICTVRSGRAYAELIYRLAARAACAGASVVAFPEYSGLPLVGLVPGIGRALAGASSLDEATAVAASGEPARPADLLAALSPYSQRVYTSVFSAVARELGVYIVTGTMVLHDETEGPAAMRHVGFVYGPTGDRLARYSKSHLMPSEAHWGFEPGRSIPTFNIGGVVAAAPVCMDATYFEPFRIARAAGVDIVIVPSANNEPYNVWYAMRGIWPRVQEAQMFGLSSCMVGTLAGMEFTGRSAIVCPIDISPGGDGVVAQASSHDDEEVVTADISLDALYAYRAANPLRFNPMLYSNYSVGLYAAARKYRTEAGNSHERSKNSGGSVRTSRRS